MAKLLISALLFLSCFYGYYSSTVTFGISVSTQAASSFLNQNGRQVLAGLQYFVQQANTWNITINNKTDQLTFAIKSMEDYGNSTIVAQNYLDMLNDSSINFFLGPMSSPLSAAAKRVTEPAGRLLLGTKVGSSTFYTGAEFSYSVTTSPPRYATTTFPEFRINNIRKIVLVVEQTPFQIDIGKGFVSNAEDFSIEVVAQYNVLSDTLVKIDDAFIQNISDVASIIRDLDGADHTFDAVVIASFTNVGRYFLEAIRNLDYTPKAVYISAYYVPDFLALDPSLVAFVSGCDVIAPGINFRGDYFGTYKEFLEGFDATMPAEVGPADANQAIGAVSGLLLMLAIQSADSLNNNEVTRALGRINEDTFFGPYQFGADHSQLRFVPFLQFVPNSEEWIQYARKEIANFTSVVNVIGPSRVQLENMVYPIPTWSERIYNPTTTPSEWAMFALAIVGIVFSIALMIVVIANRKNKIIRASSALFLVYVLFGTCMSYASIFSWNLSWLDRAACVLTPLLLGIGFTITFGCLFAKSWRIHSLYNDRNLTIKAITDAKLSIITAVVVGIEAVICIIIAIFGSEVQLVVTDPNRPAYWYTDCSVDMENTPVSFAFVIIALGYNAILMAYGIYLAVRIRSVPHKVYNESRLLAFVIYVLVIISALITALQFVATISRQERFIIRSIGIFVANMTTIIVVFGNKIHLMIKLKKDGDDGTSWGTTKNTTAMTSSNSHPQSSLSENSSKLESELNELRKEVEKLRTENEYLKQQKKKDKEPVVDKPAASASSDETTEK